MSDVYKQAGVDVEKGYEAVERMKKHIAKTTRPEVLGGSDHLRDFLIYLTLTIKNLSWFPEQMELERN